MDGVDQQQRSELPRELHNLEVLATLVEAKVFGEGFLSDRTPLAPPPQERTHASTH